MATGGDTHRTGITRGSGWKESHIPFIAMLQTHTQETVIWKLSPNLAIHNYTAAYLRFPSTGFYPNVIIFFNQNPQRRSSSFLGYPIPIFVFKFPEQISKWEWEILSLIILCNNKSYLQTFVFPLNIKSNWKMEVKSLCHLQLPILPGNVFCPLCTFL